MTLRTLKNRILCSRFFLALHVLMGRPIMYRMTGIGLGETIPPNSRIVDCRFGRLP